MVIIESVSIKMVLLSKFPEKYNNIGKAINARISAVSLNM